MESISPTVSALDADFEELKDLLSKIQSMQTDLSNVIDEQEAKRKTSIDSREVVSSFRQSFFNSLSNDANRAEDLDALLMQINDYHFDQKNFVISPALMLSSSNLPFNEASHDQRASFNLVKEDLPPPPDELLALGSVHKEGYFSPLPSPPPWTPSPIRNSSEELANYSVKNLPIAYDDKVECQQTVGSAFAFQPLRLRESVRAGASLTSSRTLSSIDSGCQFFENFAAPDRSSTCMMEHQILPHCMVVQKQSSIPQASSERIHSSGSTTSSNSSGVSSVSGGLNTNGQHQNAFLMPTNSKEITDSTNVKERTTATLSRGSCFSSTTSSNASTFNADEEQELPTSVVLSDEILFKANRVEGLLCEAKVAKLIARIYRTDRTTKSVLISEDTLVGQICRTMAEKNHEQSHIDHAIVEKIPNMKMERLLEDHEFMLETMRAWSDKSRSILFFEEKPDKFGPLLLPERYLPNIEVTANRTRSILDDQTLQTIFNDQQVDQLALREILYIKKPGHKNWIRRLCTVRRSGIFASKRCRFTTTLQDLVCVTPFHDYFRLYVTTGGWCKDKLLKAPTPFGFALKPMQIQQRESEQILYFCTSDEVSLRRWLAIIRIAKYGPQLLSNFRDAQARCNFDPKEVEARKSSEASYGANANVVVATRSASFNRVRSRIGSQVTITSAKSSPRDIRRVKSRSHTCSPSILQRQ